MTSTVYFRSEGALSAGERLAGSPRWPQAVELRSARITARAGSLTGTVLGLRVAGVLTETRVTLLPRRAGETVRTGVRFKTRNAERGMRNETSGTLVAANAAVEWEVVSGPEDVRDLVVELQVGLAGQEWAEPDLYVMWVNGPERFRLFDYDPATRLFAASGDGMAESRATLENASSFTCTIQGDVVCRGTNGLLQAGECVCHGGANGLAEEPRLEFFRDRRRLGTLTATGLLHVADVRTGLEPDAAAIDLWCADTGLVHRVQLVVDQGVVLLAVAQNGTAAADLRAVVLQSWRMQHPVTGAQHALTVTDRAGVMVSEVEQTASGGVAEAVLAASSLQVQAAGGLYHAIVLTLDQGVVTLGVEQTGVVNPESGVRSQEFEFLGAGAVVAALGTHLRVVDVEELAAAWETLPLWCAETALFHDLVLIEEGGVIVLALEQTGRTPDVIVDSLAADSVTLVCAETSQAHAVSLSTEDEAWHTTVQQTGLARTGTAGPGVRELVLAGQAVTARQVEGVVVLEMG